jgi:hypothetical protein
MEVTPSLAIGELLKRERKEIHKKLSALLKGKFDMYHIFVLCKSCFKESSLPKSLQQKLTAPRLFEFLRTPGNTEKR